MTSPGLRTYAPTPAWKINLGKVLYNLVPTFSMDNGLDINYLSHDPQVKVLYRADPLTHKYISARFGLDFLHAGEWALQNAHLLDVPMLIQAGSEDHLVSYTAAREFADKAKGCDFFGWDGLYHETHNELEKEKVLDVMVRWLDQHI